MISSVMTAFSNMHAAISIYELLPIARETLDGDAIVYLPITRLE